MRKIDGRKGKISLSPADPLWAYKTAQHLSQLPGQKASAAVTPITGQQRYQSEP